MADQRLETFAQTFSNISFGKNWASYSDIQKGKTYTDVLEALKSDAFVCGPEGIQKNIFRPGHGTGRALWDRNGTLRFPFGPASDPLRKRRGPV